MSDAKDLATTAQLALALESFDPPSGIRPPLDEIVDWTEGRLGDVRAAEVAAFVARDAECYEIWREYVESRQKLDVEQGASGQSIWSPSLLMARVQESLKTWQKAATGFAVVAITTVLVIPPFWIEPQATLDDQYRLWMSTGQSKPAMWEWQAVGTTRGAGMTAETSAFLMGISRGVERLGEWSPAATASLATLPQQSIACQSGDSKCVTRQDALVTLGEWALLNEVRCQAEDPGLVVDTQLSIDLLSAIATELRHADCSSRYCNTLLETLEKPRSVEGMCELNTLLFEQGYP